MSDKWLEQLWEVEFAIEANGESLLRIEALLVLIIGLLALILWRKW